ncbi:contactin-3-like [Littorina saxatilis]|uniref:Cell adhesion molecule-related/down-regulated by oncogenes n=1 Tax=Littorina saxatilis TaxID=31220 RepID=A0AAN9ASF0_9CAEN
MGSDKLTSHTYIVIVTFAFLYTGSHAQTIFDCPNMWENFGSFCYKFVGDFPMKFDDAAGACSEDGAGLLYVDSIEENNYIRNRLETGDPFQRTWLTSGYGSLADTQPKPGETPFVWEATSLQVKEGLQFWSPGEPDPNFNRPTGVIAYVFGETGYGWGLTSEGDANAYICKIPQAEAYRIVQTARDFDYGMDVSDVNALDKGPHFVVVPNSLVVVGQTGEQAVLECLASARPEPVYRWYRGNDFSEEVTSETDARYTLTNGRMSIQQPDESADAGDYRCVASNKYGTIVSSTVSISFGFLAEFSNVQNAPARASAYDGVAIQCSQINFKPAVFYQWLKDETQFIRTDMQAYIFISYNGKIYFSEVTASDQGEYRCIAVLTGVNQYTIGTSQPPTRTSLPIPLLVQEQSPKANWGPEIQDDFPAVFPAPPLRGQDVRLECFAYGSSTTPFYYSWQREGKPMPASASYQDHNRVLVIENAQLEDSGTYTCSVLRSSSARDSRSIQLSLGAKPYFVAPLQDQHADVGSQLTWRCDARGNPSPTYSWFKNGEILTTDSANRVQVKGNMLTISNLEAELHDGMYQCGATNFHGAEMSNAQLRVLSFVPTFAKFPLPQQVTGARGGNLSIVCNPEGAPFPIITWLKNGAAYTADGTRVTQLANGNLVFKDLSQSDTGSYTCKAENQFGDASSTTRLAMATGATISLGPTPQSVIVNSTVFIPCMASREPTVDMVYVWYFNDHLLDTDLPEYSQMDSDSSGRTGLYVRGVQFEHEGYYRCEIRTAFTKDFKQAYVTVRGPPGMPGGVKALQQLFSRYTGTVSWTDGTENGAIIIAYTVQAEDEFNTGTWTTVASPRVQDTIQAATTAQTSMRRANIEGLNPGTGYRFRVIALNQFGLGTPSTRSSYVKTLDAPPAVAPPNVRGGGGSVGDLTLEWDLLNRAEWGSSSITYRVFWRQKVDGIRQALWEYVSKASDESKHVALVGEDNFYVMYEVKVQALNVEGQGPNSSVVEVFSAMGMPLGTPTNVQSSTVNSTALEVSWEPVSNTREIVRGRIQGYQINYWPEGMLASDYHRFIRHYGQTDNGLVIGLDVDVNTWVDVQVYNSAGLGPRSEAYIMETSGDAPLHYPQEVRVYSAGPFSARVWFRGISIVTDEEGMTGYVIYYWNANENARSAVMVELPLATTDYVLTGLDESILYALRVAGVSGGGYGRKSPTQYFTFAGSVFIDYAFSQTIDIFRAPAAIPTTSPWLLSLLLLVSSLLTRWFS